MRELLREAECALKTYMTNISSKEWDEEVDHWKVVKSPRGLCPCEWDPQSTHFCHIFRRNEKEPSAQRGEVCGMKPCQHLILGVQPPVWCSRHLASGVLSQQPLTHATSHVLTRLPSLALTRSKDPKRLSS